MAFFEKVFNNFRFRGREPTKEKKSEVVEMVSTRGAEYFSWNGKLYESDQVRATIRPIVEAMGAMEVRQKTVFKNEEGIMQFEYDRNPYIKFLLQEPNPYMSGQDLVEKMVAQYLLNGNAFTLIVRNENELPMQMYPIPCTNAEVVFSEQGTLYIQFSFRNGRRAMFPYSDIIHVRRDFYAGEVLGTSPAVAMTQLMECVGTIDQGIVNAIKNSAIIKWLLKFTKSMNEEDLQNEVKHFVDTYLSYESETFGAAGVDSKVDVEQVKPHDYIPNAMITQMMDERVMRFFNMNKKMIMSDYDEDVYAAFFKSILKPMLKKFSSEFSRKIFTRKQRARGNEIVFEDTGLKFSSMATRLSLKDGVDRGGININEYRENLGYGPVPHGNAFVRRLDTAEVAAINNQTDTKEETKPEEKTEEGGNVNGQSRSQRENHTE